MINSEHQKTLFFIFEPLAKFAFSSLDLEIEAKVFSSKKL